MTSFKFEKFGPITPIEGTHTPEFFLNLDYKSHVTTYQYFTFADAAFDTVVAVPITVGVVFGIFTLINLLIFYKRLVELIQRRYKDAVQWQKV